MLFREDTMHTSAARFAKAAVLAGSECAKQAWRSEVPGPAADLAPVILAVAAYFCQISPCQDGMEHAVLCCVVEAGLCCDVTKRLLPIWNRYLSRNRAPPGYDKA